MIAAQPIPARPPVSPPSAWDTEVFLFQARDREELSACLLAEHDFLTDHPDAPLADLAAQLAVDLQPGGVRVGVVSGSVEDLRTKLRRAADRLHDPECRQIRDAGGIYFTETPLANVGTLALLFPGEGAQYLNMLADLCPAFAEVEATFALCDRIAAEMGKPEESLRAVLHIASDATPEQRAAAEIKLRELGPSIFGVLVADLALVRVLQRLALPVGAMAGHSAGELAALLAAGAMSEEAVFGPGLGEALQASADDDRTDTADSALLAVGAGRAVVTEIAEAVAGGGVMVAMDNCPHQCVAVGPPDLVALVERALQERGLLCERLPFHRPYHTPLFEPFMGPFRRLFDAVPFTTAQTPIYCGTTAALFPSEPNAIRQLTVDHWVSPVEFTKMIETMYDDGVRIFVEAGPRGNLSAFVEDILRGKPFVAIPANTTRRTGPTQINHLVAQLAAHHIPLDTRPLYEGRIAYAESAPPEMSIDRTLPASANASVVSGYLDVMEQFLDVQNSIMTAFLGGNHRALPETPIPIFGEFESLLAHEIAPPVAYALIGQVIRMIPNKEIVFRRILDEREDRYADDHTLGGRGVSRVDPAQNGLPVMPMTFSLEGIAAAACTLVPGKKVIAIRNVRLYRWLPFDAKPSTLEVRAEIASASEDQITFKANVRDLGNTFLPDGAHKPSCEATVILADDYPPPPAPNRFTLTDEQPCRSQVEDLRRNMFHGPLFQMIRSLDRVGKEGIEGTLEVQARDRWFTSNPNPHVAIDPVLVDAAMHILGAWHLEQPDWSGRILLPIGVAALEFFGPIPEVGSMLLVRGHNEEETARQVRHGVEVFAPDGRLWMRMTGASYWRFYLPFGDVNFFGPKDQYFLSRRLPEAETDTDHHCVRCYSLEPPLDLQQPVLRASGVRVSMTAREIDLYNKLPEVERSDWFFTRLVAKDAVRAAWNERYGDGTFPADIESDLDNSGRIVCRPRGPMGKEPLPPVAVANVEGMVVAISAFVPHIGLALIPIAKNASPQPDAFAQSACLAVADALRLPVEILTAMPIDGTGLFRVSLPPSAAAAHPELGSSVRARTARIKDLIVATTLCESAHG